MSKYFSVGLFDEEKSPFDKRMEASKSEGEPRNGLNFVECIRDKNVSPTAAMGYRHSHEAVIDDEEQVNV